MTRVLNEVMYVEDIQDVVPQKVSRLGFNPTETIEIEEKRVA